MSETDVIHLFFPWMLLLAFIYGVLQKYELFGDEAVSGAIALSSSFLAMAGIYFFMPENIFANFGAILAFAAFAALGFMIVMAISGIDITSLEGRTGKIPLAVGAGIMVIGLIVIAVGVFPVSETISEISFSANIVDDIIMPVLLLGFILAVIAITSS